MRKVLTLCIVQKEGEVLLGMKKRGFGQGRWNGFGGKVKGEETIEVAARRELKEEAGIEVETLEQVGILEFAFEGSREMLEVHVFKGYGVIGRPCESEEMKPEWFDVAKIPFEDMWPDDTHWFPLFLSNKKFKGAFLFDENDSIVDMALNEVKNI